MFDLSDDSFRYGCGLVMMLETGLRQWIEIEFCDNDLVDISDLVLRVTR